MAQTTFSGPIKAGTISNTTGTTIGTNIANVGQVVMSQTFAADLFAGCLGLPQLCFSEEGAQSHKEEAEVHLPDKRD